MFESLLDVTVNGEPEDGSLPTAHTTSRQEDAPGLDGTESALIAGLWFVTWSHEPKPDPVHVCPVVPLASLHAGEPSDSTKLDSIPEDPETREHKAAADLNPSPIASPWAQSTELPQRITKQVRVGQISESLVSGKSGETIEHSNHRVTGVDRSTKAVTAQSLPMAGLVPVDTAAPETEEPRRAALHPPPEKASHSTDKAKNRFSGPQPAASMADPIRLAAQVLTVQGDCDRESTQLTESYTRPRLTWERAAWTTLPQSQDSPRPKNLQAGSVTFLPALTDEPMADKTDVRHPALETAEVTPQATQTVPKETVAPEPLIPVAFRGMISLKRQTLPSEPTQAHQQPKPAQAGAVQGGAPRPETAFPIDPPPKTRVATEKTASDCLLAPPPAPDPSIRSSHAQPGEAKIASSAILANDEALAHHKPPLHSLTVRLSEGSAASTILRLAANPSGQISFSVRTTDALLAQAMQSNLNDLSMNLSRIGVAADLWPQTTVAAESTNGRAADSHRGGHEQQPGFAQESRKDRDQRRNQPNWGEYLQRMWLANPE